MEKTPVQRNKQRVNFLLPRDLVRDAKRAAGELDFTLTDFFREAVAKYLNEYARVRLEKELEEGYKANYALDARMNEEWKFADSE